MAEVSLPGLNLATVYRTLEGLHEVGLVDRMASGHDQVHYSFHDPEHRHGHLCCRHCGKVEEFDYQTIVSLAQMVRKNHDFAIDREHLTLAGICADCTGATARQVSDAAPEGSHGHSHEHHF